MKKESLMIYALHEGRLVHIDEVEKGMACNCTCPSCHAQMVARHGKMKVHHFAHYKAEPCVSGYQTAVHMRAKDILLEMKKIALPKYSFRMYEKTFGVNTSTVTIANVELEKKVDTIIPDIIVTTAKGQKIFVEIYVTHKVDDEKKKKIEALGIPAIEINLSKCEMSDKTITAAMTTDINRYAKWIYFGKESFYTDRIQQCVQEYPADENDLVQCPVLQRVSMDKNNPIQGYLSECNSCPYLFQRKDDSVICSGKGLISELADLRQTEDARWANFFKELRVDWLVKQLKSRLSYYASIPYEERIKRHGRRKHPLNRLGVQQIISMSEVADTGCSVPWLKVRGVNADGEIKEFFVTIMKDCMENCHSDAPAALVWNRVWYKQYAIEHDENAVFYKQVFSSYRKKKYRITDYVNISEADWVEMQNGFKKEEEQRFVLIDGEHFVDCKELFKTGPGHVFVSALICVNCPRYNEGFEERERFYCAENKKRNNQSRYDTLQRLKVEYLPEDIAHKLKLEAVHIGKVQPGDECSFLTIV